MPVDNQEFNRAVQRAVESSYTRTFTHISEIYKRLGNLERTERANLVSIESLGQLPPAHNGGLAFIKDIATWYYCDGASWAPVAGSGGGGGGMEVHVLASNVGLGSYHSMSGGTDGDVLRATGGATARFMRLSHNDLDGVTADQHHAKLHNITDINNHQLTAADWGVVGAVGTDTLGIRNPSANVTGVTKEALLKSDTNGYLTLVRAIASDRVLTPRVENGSGDLTLTASNDVLVTPTHWTMFADNKDMRSQSHMSGFLGQGWRISWPEVDKPHLDIRSIYAEQLEVTAFQADIMRLRIAEDYLTQGMAFTSAAFTTPSTIGGTVTVTFEDNPVLGNAQLFLNNEWVMFNIIQRSTGLITAQIWGQVSGYVDLPPDADGIERQTWVFTLRNGRTDFVVPKSSIALAWGVSGQKNGYIHHSVLSTAYGPWTRYATWTGSDPYTVANRHYHVQTGNLHGLVDIATDRYGIAAGDNLAKTPNDPTSPFKGFTADNVGGMRLFNTDISAYVGAVQKMYIAASGQEMWLGTSSSDKRFSYLNGDLTVIGTLEAAGHQFRADADGVKIKVSPGSAFEGLEESVQWLYNSLDTNLRTWIGTRVYGSGDSESQLALASIGAAAGAWGTIALRAREYGQSALLDTEGATLIVTPRNVWVGPQAGMRISNDPGELLTPVPGGQLYVDQLYADDITVTGTISGESMSGASWAYPGDMLINAASSGNTTVTVNNLGAGRADLSVDRDIIVGGNVDGVDVSVLYSNFNTHVSTFNTHVANANAHHNQAHAYDSIDHTGTLSWAKINKTGASLADLPTRLYSDLQTRAHVLATNTALGGDHTISGATAGHVLRASSATAAAFSQLQHGDLGGVTANQHHNQVHDILGSDHTIAAVQYQLVGVPTTTNVLGLLTPASTGSNVILKTDGTGGISLTNLTVANAIIANGGVDYGGDTLIEDATYLQLAGTKALNTAVNLQGSGWSLTPAGIAVFNTSVSVPTVTAPGDLTLAPASSLVLDPVNNIAKTAAGVWLKSYDYASETTGWGISPTGAGDFRLLKVNELIAKSFIVDLEQALAGGQIVTKSVTTLAAPFTAPYSSTTAITFRAKSTTSATTASLVITKPAGTLEHDFLICHFVTNVTTTVTAVPADWLLLTTINYVTTRLHIYYKLAGAAEGADYTWALSASTAVTGTIQAFSGVHGTYTIHTHGTQGGSGTNIILPATTATVNGTALLFLAGIYDTTIAGTSITPPAGYTEREDAIGGTNTWLGAADAIQAGLGTGNNPLGALTVSHGWAGALVMLTPATWNTTKVTVNDLPSATGMAVFEANDIIRLRVFSRAGGGLTITDCWGEVSGYVDNSDGTQTWTFARSAAPNAGAMVEFATVQTDAIVLDYGTDGDGYYEVNAYAGSYGSTAPYSQVVKWIGHPATGQVVRTREGNLEGITAQAGEYGLWAGAKGAAALGTADQYIRVSNLGVLINNVPLKLYNGAGVQTINLNSDGTAWFKDGAGNLKMDWNGSTLAITGQITATTGAIGGWTLGATALTAGSGATTVGLDSGGTNPAIYAGSATPASAPFRVTNAGVLTATSGTVGGWTLGATSLTSGSGASTRGIDSGGTNPAFYAGNATPGSAPFRVTAAGALYATGATIIGDITANSGTIAGTLTMGASGKIDMATVDIDANGITTIASADWSANNGYIFSFGGVRSSGLYAQSPSGGTAVSLAVNSLGANFGTAIENKYASLYFNPVSGGSNRASIWLLASSPDIASTVGSPYGYASSRIRMETDTVANGGSLIELWADRVVVKTGTVWHSGNDGANSGLDADMFHNLPIAVSGNYWGVMPYVDANGVIEIGKYIDFHYTDADTSDYSIRLTANGGMLVCSSIIGGVSLHSSSGYVLSDNAFQFVNNAGSLYQTVKTGNIWNFGGGYYGDSHSFLTAAAAASQVRAGSLLTSNLFSHNDRVPTNGIYSLGSVHIGTSYGTSYALDVGGETRVVGAVRSDVGFSMLPQASPPAVSSTYSILYVNASNQLYYLKKNGTSPGNYVAG